MLVLQHLLLPAVLAALASFTSSVSARSSHDRQSFRRIERSFHDEEVIEKRLEVIANHTLEARAAPSYGLSSSNLRSGSVSIGFLPGFGEAKGPNNLTAINALLPKPAAIVGIYCAIQDSDPNFQCLDWHMPELLAQKAKYGGADPVLAVCLMPVNGFSKVTRAVTYNLANKLKSINDQGVTVWVRYAHEMNGDWYTWGAQPTDFLASWKLVTRAVRAVTTDSYMLWSPNVRYRDIGEKVGGYSQYWPGANWVDLVGLSLYSYGGYQRLNTAPPTNFVSSTLTEFDGLYGSKQKKYMVLSETAASFAINLDTGKGNDPTTDPASDYVIKVKYWRQLLDSALHKSLPYFKAITWFEIIKDESAGGDTPVRQMDFRSLLGSKRTSDKIIEMFGCGY